MLERKTSPTFVPSAELSPGILPLPRHQCRIVLTTQGMDDKLHSKLRVVIGPFMAHSERISNDAIL